jgi:hypothetical protein
VTKGRRDLAFIGIGEGKADAVDGGKETQLDSCSEDRDDETCEELIATKEFTFDLARRERERCVENAWGDGGCQDFWLGWDIQGKDGKM